jgi:hypothetical protein
MKISGTGPPRLDWKRISEAGQTGSDQKEGSGLSLQMTGMCSCRIWYDNKWFSIVADIAAFGAFM